MAPRDPKELDPDTPTTADDELAADLATLESPITAVVDESRVRRLVEALRAQRAADPGTDPAASLPAGPASGPDNVDPAMDPGITAVDADVARRVREALAAQRSLGDALDRRDSTAGDVVDAGVARRVREALDAQLSSGDALDPGDSTAIDAEVARRVREAPDAQRPPGDALARGDSTALDADIARRVREALTAERPPGEAPAPGDTTSVDRSQLPDAQDLPGQDPRLHGAERARAGEFSDDGQGSLPARRIEIIDEPDDDEPADARGSTHAPAQPAAKGARAPSSASHRAPPSLAESPSGTRTAPREPGQGGEGRATQGRRATVTEPRTTSPLVWVAAALAAVAAIGLVVIVLTPAPPKDRPSAPAAAGAAAASEPRRPQPRGAASAAAGHAAAAPDLARSESQAAPPAAGATRPAAAPDTPRPELPTANAAEAPLAGPDISPEDSAATAIKGAKPTRIRPRNEATLSAPPGAPLESIAPSGPAMGATTTGDATAGGAGTSTLTLRGTAVDAGDRYITIKVFVDRRFVGTAPIEGHEVSAGRHTVRFDCVVGAKTYRGTTRTIDVPKNNDLVVEQACEIPITPIP